jgi:hypothetical protein
MHYVSLTGAHVEIDVTAKGEYVLAGTLKSLPCVLKPAEVVTGFVPADERRDPMRDRRQKGRLPLGRRHRDHTSAAQDIALAQSRELVRQSGEYRLRGAA